LNCLALDVGSDPITIRTFNDDDGGGGDALPLLDRQNDEHRAFASTFMEGSLQEVEHTNQKNSVNESGVSDGKSSLQQPMMKDTKESNETTRSKLPKDHKDESSSASSYDDGNSSSMLCLADSYQSKKLTNIFDKVADTNGQTLKDNPGLNEEAVRRKSKRRESNAESSKEKSSMNNNNNHKRQKLQSKVASAKAAPIASTMKTASTAAAAAAAAAIAPRTPTGCRTKPLDPSYPLQAPESILSTTISSELYEWSNVWPLLQRAGWKVMKAARYNNLHDWYYIRPNVDPGDSNTVLGRDYFMSQPDVINYIRKRDESNGLVCNLLQRRA